MTSSNEKKLDSYERMEAWLYKQGESEDRTDQGIVSDMYDAWRGKQCCVIDLKRVNELHNPEDSDYEEGDYLRYAFEEDMTDVKLAAGVLGGAIALAGVGVYKIARKLYDKHKAKKAEKEKIVVEVEPETVDDTTE